MPINPNTAASEYTRYLRANSDRFGRKFVAPDFTRSLMSALTVNSKVAQSLGNKPLPPIPGYLSFGGGYLDVVFQEGLSDFTVEMYAKVTDSVSLQCLFSLVIPGGFFELLIEDGMMRVHDDDGTIDIQFPDGLLNTWHHYAVYRESGSVSVYIDGVRASQTQLITSVATPQIYIGGAPGLENFTGQITNFRVSPRALYTVPGFPFAADDSYLLLLANPEGATIDSSSYKNTPTVTGSIGWSYGPIQIAKPIFSAYGVLTGFNENNMLYYDDFVEIDGSFTVEVCFKTSNTTNYEVLWRIRSSDDEVIMFIDNGVLYLDNDDSYFAILSPQLNTWYHVAVTYDHNDDKWYTSVNGITTYKDTHVFVTDTTFRLYIGDYSQNSDPFYSGSISNFRVSRYPRYTTNFTVPSLPLSSEGADCLILATPYQPFYDSIRDVTSSDTCDWVYGPITIGANTITILEYRLDQGSSFVWDGVEFTRVGSTFAYTGYITSITSQVPDSDNLRHATLNSVTSIGDYVFFYCYRLQTIAIPNSVQSIGNYAFQNCTLLTSITIPNSVTSIGDYAFYNCTSLESINIPNSVRSIGNLAFRNCTSLISITISNSVTSIGRSAFYNCTSLESITIPNSVTSIDNYAFNGCTSLESITIPNSVRSIGEYAFNGCTSLESITLGNSVTSIGEYAFYFSTLLRSITIPSSVTEIGYLAFGYSGLTTVTIKNGQLGIPSPASDVLFFGPTVETILP